MFEDLFQNTTDPLLLAVGLIFVSWIWEDAAVITGALLAADELMRVPLAMLAVYIGIVSGDYALYYLGRLGKRVRSVRYRLLKKSTARRLSRKFKRRTLSNILLIRFVPGLRTVGFTLCGLWQVPFARFTLAMCVSGIIWVGLVFSLIYKVGSSSMLMHSPLKWALIGVALLLLLVNNYFAAKWRK